MDNYIGWIANDMDFDAHCTFIYTGPLDTKDKADVNYRVESLKNNIDMRVTAVPIGYAMFGPEYDIPVLRLKIQGENALREIRKTLIKNGVPDPSEFGWNPHITLRLPTESTIHIPPLIKLTSFGLH